MRSRKLPTRLRQRIQNYLDYLWATQKGINESAILSELPATLQKQVTLFCSKGIIDKVPLFRGCSPDVSASIIASLVPRVYVPHDLIIERGTRGSEFFIVSEGVVVQLDEDENGRSVPRAYLHAGSYFGELAALLGGQRQESILALTHCFLYSIDHGALEDILHEHPECIDNMLSNMMRSYDVKEIKAQLETATAQLETATGAAEYAGLASMRITEEEEENCHEEQS
jgi:CRP-like cAMP-binding protein